MRVHRDVVTMNCIQLSMLKVTLVVPHARAVPSARPLRCSSQYARQQRMIG